MAQGGSGVTGVGFMNVMSCVGGFTVGTAVALAMTRVDLDLREEAELDLWR